MHVDQRNFLFGRDRAHDVRVFAMRVNEVAVLIKTPSHHRRQQNRNRFFLAHVIDESDQVPAIVFRRRVAIHLVL